MDRSKLKRKIDDIDNKIKYTEWILKISQKQLNHYQHKKIKHMSKMEKLDKNKQSKSEQTPSNNIQEKTKNVNITNSILCQTGRHLWESSLGCDFCIRCSAERIQK